MSRNQWMVVGLIALVAVAAGFYMKRKNSDSSGEQSQLPAEEAEANYSVPPNIGMSIDNTGGANFPQGESGFTYTVSQAQSLPSTGSGS